MIFNVFRKSAESRVLTSQDLERVMSAVGSSSTGAVVNPETAAKFGTVFACVRVLAESVGQLPLHLYEQGERTKNKALKHPLYTLLHDAPNEAMTSQEFWEWVVASLCLNGNAYAFINWMGADVFEILPLQATWVRVLKDRQGDVVYMVRMPSGDGTTAAEQAYRPRQILHIKGMSLDGLTGASLLTHARETIGTAMALEQYGAAFYRNGGAPGGVLKTEQVLDDETYEGLKSSWSEAHGGLDNAHRIAILEAGLSYQSVGVSLVDAQFLEGRKFSRSEIAGIFRVPPHLIGDLERATFSNIEQQALDFIKHGLQPFLTRIEQRLRLQLFPKADRQKYFAKFNVNGLARGDMAARGNYYTSQIQNGAISPNEIRELEDMNPREGGDIYLTPMNKVINGKPTDPPKTPDDEGDKP